MIKQLIRKLFRINKLELQELMQQECKYDVGDIVRIKYGEGERIVEIEGITMRVEKGYVKNLWIFDKDSLLPGYTFKGISGWLSEKEILERIK